MRVRIAMCDEDSSVMSLILGAVDAAFRANGIEPCFDLFSSGRELLRSVTQTRYDLVLLEIQLQEMDGVNLARELRVSSRETRLIFISDCEDRVFEALRVQPLAFVRKGSFFQDLYPAVELFLQELRQKHPCHLQCQTRRETVRLELARICYIEGSRNYQFIHLEGDQEPVEVKMTMDRLETATADRGFLRIHRGYLVNLRYVERITYDQAFLADGSWLPVGQSKARSVRQRFQTMQRA